MFDLFAPKVPEISVDDVKKAIDQKENFALLDVREDSEYATKRIIGSIHIPLGNIKRQVERALPDKQKTIYVYCLSGHRSAIAVSEMMKLGYVHVKSITSGLLAWRPKGYPLDTQEVSI